MRPKRDIKKSDENNWKAPSKSSQTKDKKIVGKHLAKAQIEDESRVYDKEGISGDAEKFYCKLFTTYVSESETTIWDDICVGIIEDMNDTLIGKVTIKEVKKAVLLMCPTKASGLTI
ncbi:hypothetical protein RND71_038587 [Anisodus tanguticus]|uniref:Uncharacterized protein n=1 Tax=Anisodus tanguticus TaxID=243964 RepID=A0AAE1R0C1_9SOLA|nr:hypothetical protein RND71_038587 [Anisodus tanguticus]